YEIDRMIELVENGGTVKQQTRSFDANTGTTFAIRDKEEANDYRYFPEPDLPPIVLTDDFINDVRAAMPALPQELSTKFQKEYGLNEYDAEQLLSDKAIADYFQAVIAHTDQYKAAANWINGPLRSILNETHVPIDQIGISPRRLAEIIILVADGKMNFSVAST